MHRNGPFILLLVGVVAVTVWFGTRATSALIAYTRLNTEAMAQIENLEIKESKPDRYQIFATYTFESKFGRHRAMAPIGPLYKNPWSAEKGLEKFKGKALHIWYSQERPAHSSTSKVFPMKITLSTTILIGLMLYFIGLGVFVGGQNANRS